ncbi:uncharacterized protein LOC23687462 [Aedes aegypti]|uniref:Uncharacterized protein n=1 Tax=Aedes aegypti TaxID=7159 RepID=A0A6I8TR08_AEDAE|nr:uncharacterized protein LOC23687462 [Aedes aegypti]
MDPLLSHKQQKAADIRDAIREYHAARNPWGPDHRAHAVFLGVQRNNARRGFDDEDDDDEKGWCWYLGWLLILTIACVAVWYTWMRAVSSAQKLAIDFPAMGSIGGTQCHGSPGNSTFIQVANCTLIESVSFAKGLGLVLQSSYDD